jgi:hypothetical protein
MAISIYEAIMFKQLLLSLAVACPLFVLFGNASPAQDSSERRIRKSQATEKSQRSRSKAAQRAIRPQASGWPPCQGLLWVDTLCQLNDGRLCYVDENILVNCQ